MTCVQMNCPFICHCRHYNFSIDRGAVCTNQVDILQKAKTMENAAKNKIKNVTRSY